MARRREIIEAMLRVKDQGRFKTGMKSAARSVRDFGYAGSEAAAKDELLVQVLQQLQREAVETRIVMHGLGRAVNDVGDEMTKTAVKSKLAKSAMGGLNIPLKRQLTSWKFWKDRLSLTRGEIMTTAITIGSYLSPALIALGSSAAAALMGGALVGGGGLAALITGIGGLGLVSVTALGQMKKVKTAQDAYNVAVAQYGEGSKQAAAASAHLYAVIQNNGGVAVLKATQAVQKLKDTWTLTTGESRRNLFGIITSGIGGVQRLLPTFARETNRNSGVIRSHLGGAFQSLSGEDMKKTITALSGTFRQMFGPTLRGGVNLVITLGRWLRVAATYAAPFADSFERWSRGLRARSGDATHVEKTVGMLVEHFRAWLGLGRSLGTTLRLIFRGSNQEGLGLVYTLTNIVNKFNEWLDGLERSGRLRGAFRSYLNSLTDIVWAVQHPIDAINQYLPIVIDTIAVKLAQAAPHAFALFWNTFWQLGDYGKFLTVAFLLSKFGAFRFVGRIVGTWFAAAFAASAFPGIAGRMAATSGGLSAAAAASGTAAGTAFSVSFLAAVGPLIVVGLAHIIQTAIESAIGRPLRSPGDREQKGLNLRGGGRGDRGGVLGFLDKHKPSNWFGLKKAAGGMIYPGQAALVGDAGPEIAIASPGGGAAISTIGRGSANLRPVQPASIDVASMTPLPPVHVHVDVNKREIGRANIDFGEDRKSKRGGRP